MFEESDDDGHQLQQQRPSCSKCFWSFIKHAHSDKTGITSLNSGDLVFTAWPICKVELSYKQLRVFLPNWSNEAFTHCRGSIKSTDVQPALSSTHGAKRHRWPGWSPSTCVKRTKLCVAFSELPYSVVTLSLGWIQDVLNNRQQCVILEAEKSGFINVGPILFLTFINGGLTKLQTGQKAKLV